MLASLKSLKFNKYFLERGIVMQSFQRLLSKITGIMVFTLCLFLPGLATADVTDQLEADEQLVVLTVENMT